jgi:hypothetical protein
MRLRWSSTGDDENEGFVDTRTIQWQAQGATCPALPADYNFSNPTTASRGRSQAGTYNESTIDNLDPETCYAFEVQPFDEADNTPGPSFATGTTLSETPADYWTNEVLPISTYRKVLGFDPATNQPVILGSHNKATYSFTRSSTDFWSYQRINREENDVSLEVNPVFDRLEAVIQKHGRPQHARLQPDGSWDINQVSAATVDRAFTYQALSFVPAGYPDAGYPAITYSDDGIHLARYNGSSFDIEILPPHIPGGGGPALQFDSSGQPVIAYHNGSGQIYLATFDGFMWSYETVASRPDVSTMVSFHFDPNGEPVVMYREGIAHRYERLVRMARRDGAGGWTAMTIEPDGIASQGVIVDMVYAADGTLYLAMGNLGSQGRVGRFCEDRTAIPDNKITCAPTVDIDGNNIWLWENAADTDGGAWSIAIDTYNDTVAVITSGNTTSNYRSCNPGSDSVICGK